VTVGLVLLVALVTWQYNAQVAFAVSGAWVLGWHAWFHGTRAILSLLRGRRSESGTTIRGVIGIVGCVALGLTRFAPIVLMSLASWFLIDLVVLRFKG
jgi:hypothetical protein